MLIMKVFNEALQRREDFHYKGFSENKNNKDQRINFCFLFLPQEIRKLEELFFVPSFGVKVEKMRRTSNLMMAAVLHFQFEHLFNFTVKHHLKKQHKLNNSSQRSFVLFVFVIKQDVMILQNLYLFYGNTNIVQYYHESKIQLPESEESRTSSR